MHDYHFTCIYHFLFHLSFYIVFTTACTCQKWQIKLFNHMNETLDIPFPKYYSWVHIDWHWMTFPTGSNQVTVWSGNRFNTTAENLYKGVCLLERYIGMIVFHKNHRNIDKIHPYIDWERYMYLHLTKSDVPSDFIIRACNHFGGSRG